MAVIFDFAQLVQSNGQVPPGLGLYSESRNIGYHPIAVGGPWVPHPSYSGSIIDLRVADATTAGPLYLFHSSIYLPAGEDDALLIAQGTREVTDFIIPEVPFLQGNSAPHREVGIAYRIQEGGRNFYLVRTDDTTIVLSKVVNGVETVLGSFSAALSSQRLTAIQVVGNKHYIASSVAGSPLEITVTDSTFTSGAIGLWAGRNNDSGQYAQIYKQDPGLQASGAARNMVRLTATDEFASLKVTLPELLISGVLKPTNTAPVTTEGNVVLPELLVSATMLAADAIAISAGAPTLAITSVRGSVGSIKASTGAPTLQIASGQPTFALSAGAPIVTIQALSGASIDAQLSAGAPTVSITSLPALAASFAVTLPEITIQAKIEARELFNVTVRAPAPDIVVESVSGQPLRLAVQLPELVVQARASGLSLATVQVYAGAPTALITSTSDNGVVRGTALNLRRRAVSEYSDLTANSVTSFAGMTLIADANGVHVLDASDDLGQPIQAEVLTGRMDFTNPEEPASLASSTYLKRPTDAYIGCRADGPIDFVVVSDDSRYSYPLQVRKDAMGNAKTGIGRGISNRYLQFGVTNRDGADFALDSMLVLAEVLSRRIGGRRN